MMSITPAPGQHAFYFQSYSDGHLLCQESHVPLLRSELRYIFHLLLPVILRQSLGNPYDFLRTSIVFRTAILIITVALLAMFFNSWLKLRAQKPPEKKPKPKKIRNEPMVRCEFCGIHIPKSRAVEADGRIYCSKKHQHAHAKSLNHKE